MSEWEEGQMQGKWDRKVLSEADNLSDFYGRNKLPSCPPSSTQPLSLLYSISVRWYWKDAHIQKKKTRANQQTHDEFSYTESCVYLFWDSIRVALYESRFKIILSYLSDAVPQFTLHLEQAALAPPSWLPHLLSGGWSFCGWDDHIRNIFCLWHHGDPWLEKNCLKTSISSYDRLDVSFD